MNEQTKWRVEYATRLFTSSFNNVNNQLKAVFIGGSVGGKFVDEYSDLELCFIWNTTVNSQLLNSIFEKEGLKLFSKRIIHKPIPSIEYTLHKNDFQIDFFHYSTQDFDKLLNLQFQEKLISLDIQAIYFTVLNCKILKGNDYLGKFQKNFQDYPASLTKAIIKKYTTNFLKADIGLFLQRKDWVIFYNLISGYQKLIFLILLALNKIYFPSFKNSSFYINQFTIKPDNTSLVFEQLYEFPPSKILQIIIDTQLSIIDIIKENYPEIDFSENFKHLTSTRKAVSSINEVIGNK